MRWPKEILDAFDVAVQPVVLEEGYTKPQALLLFLDTAASMAVWRCKADPEALEGAYSWPFTPIGHLTNTGFGGTMRQFTLRGEYWGQALGLLKRFVHAHREEICREYEATPVPYPHEL